MNILPDLAELNSEYGAVSAWDTETILPDGFLPMLPATAPGPLDSVEHAYEIKWEGLRVLAGLEGYDLVLRNSTGQDVRPWFPELAALREAAQPFWAVLDGELVVLEDGLPSITALQRRLRASDSEQVAALAEELPAAMMVSDILRIGDSWMLDVTWDERREVLPRAVDQTACARIVPVFPDGRAAADQARMLGLDGVVGKKLRGRYYPGEQTRDWLSIKPKAEMDVLVGGWVEGRGARAGTIGTLLFGIFRGRDFVYVGHTGTGLDARSLAIIHRRLVARGQRSSPFVNPPEMEGPIHWVRPDVACHIRYKSWTEEGKLKGAIFMYLPEETETATATGERSAVGSRR